MNKKKSEVAQTVLEEKLEEIIRSLKKLQEEIDHIRKLDTKKVKNNVGPRQQHETS